MKPPKGPLFSPQRGEFQTHTYRPGCFSGHCPRDSCSPSSAQCPASPSWKVPKDRCSSVHHSCWLQGQRDQERPPRHCWQLSPSSFLGEVALEQAGSILTGCCGHSCSVTPGGTGQWETLGSPFAFLQWFGGEPGGVGGLPCGKVSGCQIQPWAAPSASHPSTSAPGRIRVSEEGYLMRQWGHAGERAPCHIAWGAKSTGSPWYLIFSYFCSVGRNFMK